MAAGWRTHSMSDCYDIKIVEHQTEGLRRAQPREADLIPASLQNDDNPAENEAEGAQVAERPTLQ
jgi:hypothetical protein